MKPERRLGRVLGFLREIWALDHELQALSKRMHRQIGLTGPQRLTLRIAARFPDLTAGDLAAELHLHPSTLTGVLKRLEARGLIERRCDEADGRRCRLRVTPAGLLHAQPDQKGTAEQAVRRVLERTPERDVAGTCRLLRAIAAEIASASPDPERPRSPSRRHEAEPP